MKESIQEREVARRDFLKTQLCLAATVSVGPFFLHLKADEEAKEQGKLGSVSTKEALYYEHIVYE